VSSATDEKVKDKAGASGKNEPKTKRPNPVALEVPVSVAGARPASAHDKRELFTEDTTTVLVFKDGAVIQLSAAIAVGQLLFLTDKRSKKEVVCQVVHKRSHRPTTCYVELEFTEDVKNFWGVSFPDQEETEERPRTAAAVEAEETTEDDHSEPPAAPKTEDVAQLKEEVEALRAQLRELKEKQAKEEKPAAENADAQARRLAEAELAARAAAETEAKERAEEMDRKARANAARLAEEARRKLAEAQSQAQEQTGNRPGNSASAEEDDGKRRLAEAELAARAAAEAEAAARAAAEANAKQNLWTKDEEERKASEEARKWEQESIENERKRKQEEKERRERTERGEEETPAAEAPTPAASEVPTPSLPSPPPPKIGMRLPSAAPLASGGSQTPMAEAAPAAASTGKEAIDPLEELLPKPALDFSKAPKGLDPNDPYNIYKPMRKKAGWLEIAMAAVIVVVLVGGGGFAWYKNKLPFFHRGPKAPEAVKTAPAAKPAASAAANAIPAAPPASGTAAPATTSAQPADNGTAGAAAHGTNAAPAAAKESAPEMTETEKNDASTAAPEAKAREKKAPENKMNAKKEAPAKAASNKGGKNHGKAETSSESKPKAEEAVAEDAPVVPAKLLHAVQPVYPPDAMLNYITGDVRIEAVVDATGHVGAMQVLIGPAALRKAAMDALRQYEYEPATQGGKAVASKVVVTVKFWFDP